VTQDPEIEALTLFHTNLFEDLHPSVRVHKRFDKEIAVKYLPSKLAAECSLARKMRVEARASTNNKTKLLT